MKKRNIQRLENAAERIQRAMELIDIALEQDGDNFSNSDYYYLQQLSIKMFTDINMIRTIVKVAKEDSGYDIHRY